MNVFKIIMYLFDTILQAQKYQNRLYILICWYDLTNDKHIPLIIGIIKVSDSDTELTHRGYDSMKNYM